MEIRNCARCKKIFTFISVPICPECIKEEENDFIKIKEYITDNPGCRVKQIVDDTGVELSRIQKFMKEGRLEATTDMLGIIECESCHKPIKTGRFCEHCMSRINDDIGHAISGSLEARRETLAEKQKMHITKKRL